jgi:hypothetical protein
MVPTATVRPPNAAYRRRAPIPSVLSPPPFRRFAHLDHSADQREELAEHLLGQLLRFSSWPCRRPSTTSLNDMVLRENFESLDDLSAKSALSPRPVVVDGRLRGHDEKGEVYFVVRQIVSRAPQVQQMPHFGSAQ